MSATLLFAHLANEVTKVEDNGLWITKKKCTKLGCGKYLSYYNHDDVCFAHQVQFLKDKDEAYFSSIPKSHSFAPDLADIQWDGSWHYNKSIVNEEH